MICCNVCVDFKITNLKLKRNFVNYFEFSFKIIIVLEVQLQRVFVAIREAFGRVAAGKNTFWISKQQQRVGECKPHPQHKSQFDHPKKYWKNVGYQKKQRNSNEHAPKKGREIKISDNFQTKRGVKK